MKILLVGQNLQIGGVQTALVNLVKTLINREEFELDVFLFGEGELVKEVSNLARLYQGSKALRLVATPFREVLKSKKKMDIIYRILLMIMVRLMGSTRFYNWLFKKQKVLGPYDIAISYFNDVPHSHFNQGTNQYVLDYVESPAKLAWIHTDPIEAGFEKETSRKLYEGFTALICVSNACAEKFKEFLPEFSHKIKTVYNLFPIEEIQEKAELKQNIEINPSFLTFVTVTRVENGSKNLRRISEVCRMLEKESLKNYKWIIVGDGPDLEKNRKEINEAGLTNRVDYIGSRANPYPYIAESDLFILTSNYEGFPMVIQEAFILGVPVLTTPYAAVKEQVKHGVNGIVTEMNVESIFTHLKKILEKPNSLDELKANIQSSPVSNQLATDQLFNILKN
ncbi:glycosyltransferase [Alkalibacterium sp. 20]|uniref:glycosyltransferase n=1 Tax=Alkalibacterium sp. 20 TaxID=1798803 RepID=UPI0008FFEAE3|nr:glycosyltransferase [Alkalibacterium sp. 20]OJF94205.1 hypothetical protein AX762_07805 [Alkalibacterium sp. 20]